MSGRVITGPLVPAPRMSIMRDQPRGLVPVEHRYVDWYWLPVIGPSSVCLLRRLALIRSSPARDVDSMLLARAIGLSTSQATTAPFCRTLRRLHAFGLIDLHRRDVEIESLGVSSHVGFVPAHLVNRLPEPLANGHGHDQGEFVRAAVLAVVP